MSLNSTEIAALLAAPALEAPSGVTANFTNPPNKNGLAWFVTTFCLIIATLALLIRVYAKLYLTRSARIEEYLMLGAYGAYLATACAGYALIYSPGYYVHQWNLHNKDLIEPLYLILVYGCSYSATLALIKTAILIDWCRIFVPDNRSTNLFWRGCMFVVFLQLSWGIACIILLNMQCVPHEAIWKFYLPSKCYSLPKVMLTSASVQVVSDWTMVMLPQKIIWGLKMNWQKKVGVSVLFGIGLLASISASVRLSTTITFANETDTMYYIGPLLFWACAEMSRGFFIFCVPCIATVIRATKSLSRVTSALGLSHKFSPAPPSARSNTIFPSRGNFEVRPSPKDAYYTVDEEEENCYVGTYKPPESQEQLQNWVKPLAKP